MNTSNEPVNTVDYGVSVNEPSRVEYLQHICARILEIIKCDPSKGGNLLEVGVYRGGTLLVLARALRDAGLEGKKVYAIDTFEGHPYSDGHEVHPQGKYADVEVERIQELLNQQGLSEYVEFIKGRVEDVLGADSECGRRIPLSEISFAHIDCDLEKPIAHCCKILDEKMPPHGVLFFDDYMHDHCPGATRAIRRHFGEDVEPIEIEANRRITAWSCLIELRARRKEGNTLVEFEKYKYGYKNNRNKSFELRDIDLEIRRGDIICVVGKSGCGKSTLLKSIADILPEAETNHGVRRHEAFLSGGSIGYLFQHEEWLDWCSVWKNLDTLLRIATDWPAEKRNSKIAESLHFGGLGEQFSDIDDLKNELPKNLSGGQQRRVALGSVLCLDTQLYLLDEPTDKFDFKLKVDVQEELYRRWFLDPDFTCVVVTHDLDEAVFLGDHVICMDDGKIIAAKENKLKGMRSGVRYGRKDFADAVREIESVFYNEWGR